MLVHTHGYIVQNSSVYLIIAFERVRQGYCAIFGYLGSAFASTVSVRNVKFVFMSLCLYVQKVQKSFKLCSGGLSAWNFYYLYFYIFTKLVPVSLKLWQL